MIEYKIFWKKSAVKELKKIPNQFADKIYDAISELSNEPRPDNSKNMVSLSKHYRLKVGDYRVVYSIEDKILIIEIIRIAHRKEVYKWLYLGSLRYTMSGAGQVLNYKSYEPYGGTLLYIFPHYSI